VTDSGGAITLSSDMQSATIRDTAIRVDADDVPAIRAKPANSDETTNETQLSCENVTIVGSAANGQSIEVLERGVTSFGVCASTRPARTGMDSFHTVGRVCRPRFEGQRDRECRRLAIRLSARMGST